MDASPEGDNLLVFYYLYANATWPDKRVAVSDKDFIRREQHYTNIQV